MHITSKNVKALSEASSDRDYPHDGTKRRSLHSDYALSLINQMRTEPLRSYLLAGNDWGGVSEGRSGSIEASSYGSFLGRIATIEANIYAVRDLKKVKTELGGKQRHELASALGGLFFKSKAFDRFLKNYALGSQPAYGVVVEMLAEHFQE